MLSRVVQVGERNPPMTWEWGAFPPLKDCLASFLVVYSNHPGSLTKPVREPGAPSRLLPFGIP